jgi:hypothetical protein
MKRQLLLRGEKTVNEVLRQTLILEVIKLAVGSCVMLLKTSDGIVEELAPSQTKEEITHSLRASAVGAPATL